MMCKRNASIFLRAPCRFIPSDPEKTYTLRDILKTPCARGGQGDSEQIFKIPRDPQSRGAGRRLGPRLHCLGGIGRPAGQTLSG